MPTKVICISNQNGGAGKTTTAVSLAHGLARSGKRVLLIDIDPQAGCSTALGLRPEPGAFHLLTRGESPRNAGFIQSWVRFSGRDGVYLLPGDQQTMTAQTILNMQYPPVSSIRSSIRCFFREALHYIIFDTSPMVRGIQKRAIWASDLVILPTPTEFLSADRLAMALLMLSNLQERQDWSGNLFGILPTFHDERTPEGQATLEDLRQRFHASVLPPIHRSSLLREGAAEGRTIFEIDPASRAACEYLALSQRVMKF